MKKSYSSARHVESTKSRVLAYLYEHIPEGTMRRIPYGDIADALGCSRSAVRYSMSQLYKLKFVDFEDGKIRLCEKKEKGA